MHRIDTQGHKQNKFSDGNPTDTTGETGTVIDSAWLNAVQEEICSVVESFGGNLGKGTEFEGQMAAVLQKAFLKTKEEFREVTDKLIYDLEAERKDRKASYAAILAEISALESSAENPPRVPPRTDPVFPRFPRGRGEP